MNFCPTCGSKITENTSKFCSCCGNQLNAETHTRIDKPAVKTILNPSNNNPTVSLPTWSYAVIGMLLAVNTAICFYVLFHPGAILISRTPYQYIYHLDAKLFIWTITGFNVLGVIICNRKQVLPSIAMLSAAAYQIGLYAFTRNYLWFDEQFDHHLYDESIAYSGLVMGLSLLGIGSLVRQHLQKNKTH